MMRSLLRMLKHISLALLAIVAAVCIAEVGMRGYQLNERCNGESASRAFAATPCPVAFQRMTPFTQSTHRAADSGELITIETNILGLRGPEIAIPKQPGVFRIVCLGDDATLAPDIAFESTFPAVVGQMLAQQSEKPVEVINAGVPGHCPLLSQAWARQRLTGLQPDLVVLCCDHSDIADDRHVRPLASYAANGQLESVCHPAVSRHPRQLVQAIEREFALAEWVRRQASASLGTGDDELPGGWEATPTAGGGDRIQIRQTWEPIAALRDLCMQLNADFVVAIVPSMSTQATAATGSNQIVELLGDAAEAYGVPYLDVNGDFSPSADPPLFLRRSGAMSDSGHHLFAELLSWAIVQREQSNGLSEAPASVITPAAASSSTPSPTPLTPSRVAVPPVGLPSEDATPLPTPGRRPRGTEDTSWSR